MSIQQVYEHGEEKMVSALNALHKEFSGVRTGRASTSLLDGIRVEYYGSHIPLNQAATLSVPEPRLIIVQPWDINLTSEIEKAIRSSELGLNPANDGRIIRIPIPQLNEERRKQLVKLVKHMAEECRISIRNARREGMETLKRLEKEKEIAEDDHHKAQAHIQKLHDEYIKQIDQALEQKESEIMEV